MEEGRNNGSRIWKRLRERLETRNGGSIHGVASHEPVASGTMKGADRKSEVFQYIYSLTEDGSCRIA